MASSLPSWVRPPQYSANFAPLFLCNRLVPLHFIHTNTWSVCVSTPSLTHSWECMCVYFLVCTPNSFPSAHLWWWFALPLKRCIQPLSKEPARGWAPARKAGSCRARLSLCLWNCGFSAHRKQHVIISKTWAVVIKESKYGIKIRLKYLALEKLCDYFTSLGKSDVTGLMKEK